MKLLPSILLLLGATWFFHDIEAVAQGAATYEVTFLSSWSATTHPQDFPSSPHFSELIGATHDSTVAFWTVGELASPGIKNMAETGSKTALRSEINVASGNASAETLLDGGGITPTSGSVSLTFSISETYPLVMLVSMLAPSPDWFVGVAGLSLRAESGWIDTLTVDLFTYDAGTDSGTTYAAANQATDPPQPITKIETGLFLVNEEVPPVARFTFVLQSVEQPTLIEEAPALLATHVLSAVYPNPSPQAAFTLTVRHPQHVRIDLFDLNGRRVDTLYEGFLQAGTSRRFTIGGKDLPSGVYLYRVVGEDFADSRAVVLVR